MGSDPLAMGALAICGLGWLLTAAALTLDLLGHLPGAQRRNARAFRLQQSAGLVFMTMAVLSEAGALAHWANPARTAIAILTVLAGIGGGVAVVKAAVIRFRASNLGSLGSRPSSQPGGSAGGR